MGNTVGSSLRFLRDTITSIVQGHMTVGSSGIWQQRDYSVMGFDAFNKKMDGDMAALLANSHLSEFFVAVLAEAEKLGADKTLPVFELLKQRKFAEWNKACADLVASNLPVGDGVAKNAQFLSLINGYQGKYAVPELVGQNDTRLLIKNAPRVGSEQLLRRLFAIDGQVLYNPFGGFFLAKIQDLPYMVKFWLLLRNIVEVVPRMKAGEDVTINYFAQLFGIKSADGMNLYDGLQNATQELWHCKFQAEAMDLEQKMRKEDTLRLGNCLEEIVVAHPHEFSLDDFGPTHLLWSSKILSSIELKEVKMSPEYKAKVVDQWLQKGTSSLLLDWIQKVREVKGFQCVILEGSDNCAGVHPGVIFTEETRADTSIKWTDTLQKFTQFQVEDAHADVVTEVQRAFPGKPVRIQGGFGVLEKEVDGAFANLCAQLGLKLNNVAATFGSCAWLTWAKGNTRSYEMGLADQN